MQSAGLELKQAREHAGLSAENIAERTKFKLLKIEALERSDFENLPNGIYLDGIVRAYARELALDPEPLVERLRLERGKLPGDSPIPFHEPMEFERPVVVDAVATEPIVPQAPEHASRSHNSMAVAVLALLALLGWGAYFYQAARAVDRDTSGKNYMSLPAQVAPGAEPIAFTENAGAHPPEPPAADLTDDAAPDPVRVASARRPRARPRAIENGAAGDVTGEWRLATQVESTSVARYAGLLLGYEIQLEQDGDSVTGIGRKIIENGNGIDSRGQTPIAVNGVVDGDQITLSFLEGGARRSTQGTFRLTRDADGMLRGRFTSNAARSAGSVEARRVR